MSTAVEDNGIKWALLREAYEAIKSSVADDDLNLEDWKCGTLACAAGHLAQMPKFQERGLGVHQSLLGPASGFLISYREPGRDALLHNFTALRYFFGLAPLRADELFGQRTSQEKLDVEMTDKDVWLERMRVFFKEHRRSLD